MHPSAPAPAVPDSPAPDGRAPDLLHPTPLPCPDCGAPLPPSPVGCPACGLPLRGPAAARLWEVDRELAELGARTGALRRERVSLLQVLG
ncbi:MAG: hypothetical protein M3P95_11055, partial [Actinomycetota bacterium]|nr:hypothetical protein [Actinomycetota bacterium]